MLYYKFIKNTWRYIMEINLQRLDTEQVNENTKNIDSLSTLDMVTAINNEDKKVALAVEKVLPNIANAIDETYKRIKNGIYYGCIIYCNNILSTH